MKSVDQTLSLFLKRKNETSQIITEKQSFPLSRRSWLYMLTGYTVVMAGLQNNSGYPGKREHNRAATAPSYD